MKSTQPTNTLNGLRVMITRPIAQAEDWQACLTQAGAETILVPMLAIEPLPPAIQEKACCQLKAFEKYSKVIFVSLNAVKYAFHLLAQQKVIINNVPHCFAIGPKTARSLKKALDACCDETVITTNDQAMNSETLLSHPDLSAVSGQRILICRGAGGRTLLGDELQQRGAAVEYCELYRRVQPSDSIERLKHACVKLTESATDASPCHEPSQQSCQTPTELISVHSGETLDNLNQAIQLSGLSILKHQPLLVPSPRVANKAVNYGFETLIVADNATDNAMLTALQTWYKAISW